MKMAPILDRLQGTGGDKWKIYHQARERIAAGEAIINMTIGEPDIPAPSELVDSAIDSMKRGRTNYANARGEAGLLDALAAHYSAKCGREISSNQFICLPGTQTSLFTALMGLAGIGEEVLVGDPMYATYEGAIWASGASMKTVPLRPENGFHINAKDIAERITSRSRAILLTHPHNPSGAVLTKQDIDEIGQLALDNDLWIISDEVYDELIFDERDFLTLFADPHIADRVAVVSSISKSHATPGFRSGWCVGSEDFIAKLLPLAEAMLFGNQPFIADMTEKAIREGSSVAKGMRNRFAARAEKLENLLSSNNELNIVKPEAGMFAMVNVSSTGMTGEEFAQTLLDEKNVAVMPGASFGSLTSDWIRIALTVKNPAFDEACNRIVGHAKACVMEVA